MKPKTKEHKWMLEKMQLFPELTERQRQYAYSHCFDDEMIESRGRMVCTHCTHSWRLKDADKIEEAVCPHCGKKLKVVHNKAVSRASEYFAISRKVGEYQAFQFFMVKRMVKKGVVEHWENEVGTMFLDMKGKFTCFSRNRFTMSYMLDAWSWDSEIALRNSDVLYRLGVGALYVTSMHPTLKRNGWNGKLFQYDCTHIPRYLLMNPQFESLWKIGQYGICLSMMSYSYHRNALTEAEKNRVIKLCNRYGKIMATQDEWIDLLDYVDDLKYLKRDFGNPKILFPENFQEEKMRINNKRHEKERIEARERRIRYEMEQAEREKKKKEWIRIYQRRFKDMCITSDGFTIKALLTRNDFDEEFKALNHCIRTYYGKIDTLLVSISVNDKRTETAEVSLNDYKIVQCRGANNQPSKYHDKILQVLQGQLKIFKAYNERKFVKVKNKVADTPTVTPNLPAVIYKMVC